MKNKTAAAHSEPFVRMVKRSDISFSRGVLIRTAAILAALVADALFIFFVTGLNPLDVYKEMFLGTFGNKLRFIWCARDTTTLLCIGVALAPAFKMKFWNIGAEGQILMGALATAFCMLYLGNSLPTPLLFSAMIITSIIAGGIWGLIPAYFKARWNTNETLFTLMMNYVAIQLVACCTNIWRGQASSLGKLNMDSQIGWFPAVFGQRYMINIFIILAFTVLMFIYLKYTKHGYEISVVGESTNTARYAGINVKKVMLRTMAISGAICGISGFLIVSGKDQTISTLTAGGQGFTAIIVAWLAKFNTFFMMLISFLLIFLERGASQIASSFPIMNDYASDIVSGIILFFILGCEFFINYKLIFRKGGSHNG
jgi:ABC-type uncharacterized transport system permease subunit